MLVAVTAFGYLRALTTLLGKIPAELTRNMLG
jgi:hypothetical protein